MAYRPYIWRKNNPEKRLEQRRREKVRTALRKKGILPPVGTQMNEEQLIINEQISNNDFSYWDSIKLKTSRSGGIDKQIKVEIKSPEYLIWYRVKTKCYEKNIPFDLSVEDIIIPEICEITLKPLLTSLKDSNKGDYYTLYPIDGSKGYIKENVRVISVDGFFEMVKTNPYNEGLIYDTSHYTPKENEISIYNRAKKNAERNKWEFNLDKTDIIIPTHCKYLGLELTYNKMDSMKDNYFSIDRIDSSKGYVKGNVQIISRLANTMKSSSTIEQLITFSENILKLYKS